MKKYESRITDYISQITHHIPQSTWLLAAALLIGGVAAWPLFSQSGLLNTRGGGDSPFLLQRLHQLVAALADGHFPVRWMPDANYGYGYPFYNYYAPLSIYIAAAFRLLGFSYVLAIKLAQLSGFLVAAWAMFQLGRQWIGNHWAGLLAAAAYTLAPFHMANVYVRGDSLAEFWAMAFYPLVFLAAGQLFRSGRQSPEGNSQSKIAFFALAYAALILSHNISALIFTPFLLLYLVFAAWGKRFGNQQASVNLKSKIGNLKWPFLALVLALALSAWFWLPALSESYMVQLEPVTAGYFHYGNHFRGLDLIQPGFFFDYMIGEGSPFRMGLIQSIAIILGLIALVTYRGINVASRNGSGPAGDQSPGRLLAWWPRLFIVIGLVVAIFMITPLSRPLWDNLPLLSFTQFPWRFLSLQAFFGSLAVAGLTLLPGRRFIVPIAVLLLLVTSLGDLKSDFLTLSDADVTADRLAQYEWFTGNIGSTVSAEYLPENIQPRPYTSAWLNQGERDAVQQLDSVLSTVDLLSRKAARQSWRLGAQPPAATLTLPTLEWPIWRATVSGEVTDLQPAPGSGLIMLAVPVDDHVVNFQLGRTPIRLVSELIALSAFIMVIWILRPQKMSGESRFRLRLRRSHFLAAAGLIFLFLFLRLIPERAYSSDDLTWDFSHMAYLHHDTNGVPFDNGALLASYEYGLEEVRPGEELELSLFWDEGSGAEVTVDLATPAVNRFKRAPLLLSQTQPLTSGPSTYRLRIPENAPAGLYVPRVTVSDAQPLMPSGQTRGDLFLRPLRVLAVSQPVGRNGRLLDARAVQVSQRNPSTLDVKLQWETMQALTRNYNYSLRLTDAQGQELVQVDGQPGYGFQPSSLWTVGTWINDWLAMRLPEDLPRDPGSMPLALVVRLYDVQTGEVVLTRRLGELEWQGDELSFQVTEPEFSLPPNIEPITAEFGDGPFGPLIRLRGYESALNGADLKLTLYWEALSNGSEDFFHFVHLVDPNSEQILAQHDSMPRNDSYPTSQWTGGEVVSDSLFLDVSEIPAGEYVLHIGLFKSSDDGLSRLAAVDEQGRSLPNDRLRLPWSVIIER